MNHQRLYFFIKVDAYIVTLPTVDSLTSKPKHSPFDNFAFCESIAAIMLMQTLFQPAMVGILLSTSQVYIHDVDIRSMRHTKYSKELS